MPSPMPVRSLLAATSALLLATQASHAADLVIGSSTEPSSIDPHFSRTGNNQNIAAQIFDRLILPDPNLQVTPALATAWTNTGPSTWQIKLRGDARFHDGAMMTAEDVVYSLERSKNIPNSPAPFTGNMAEVADMTIIDDTTIDVTTKYPTPDLIEQIGLIYIV